MPIREPDHWRFQFFDRVPCPDNVAIPTKDPDAWTLFPAHRWIYDKLAVALSQGLDAAPHGVLPPFYPVFSKPMVNLRSMGAGSQAIASEAEYLQAQTAGHFWCTLLTGAHVSTDAALVDGIPRWWRHATGEAMPGGTFDHWHIHPGAMPEIESWCGAWSAKHLRGYTGMVNFETIGGRIIEAHLRFADQWPDLYGPGWVEALIGLYAHGVWNFPDTDRRDGYSVVDFLPHGPRYRYPPPDVVAEVEAMDGISSVQLSFHEGRDPASHSMPPGGFRVTTVNAHALEAGRAGREVLRRAILRASGLAG